jgi:hypothetical protein
VLPAFASPSLSITQQSAEASLFTYKLRQPLGVIGPNTDDLPAQSQLYAGETPDVVDPAAAQDAVSAPAVDDPGATDLDSGNIGVAKPFVLEEHLNAIMGVCGAATLPADQSFTPECFWQALLAMAWVTGMRKLALISLRWDDVDLEAGIALSRYGDNNAKRDQRHKIGPVVGLLRKLHASRRPGEPRVFPWNYCLKILDRTLARIQKVAKIALPCREDHQHTDACYLYGFHSFRYAHATHNFGRVSGRDLQEQMGHATFNTMQRYIKYAENHQQRVYDVFLPASLKVKVG